LNPSDRLTWDEGDLIAHDSLEEAVAARDVFAAFLRERLAPNPS
jgi:hypothetical protein